MHVSSVPEHPVFCRPGPHVGRWNLLLQRPLCYCSSCFARSHVVGLCTVHESCLCVDQLVNIEPEFSTCTATACICALHSSVPHSSKIASSAECRSSKTRVLCYRSVLQCLLSRCACGRQYAGRQPYTLLSEAGGMQYLS